MFEGRRVVVVVPAYNEEKLIGRVLDTMRGLVDRVIVVDDASTDQTAQELEAAQARLGARLCVIRLAGNRGVGGAIVAGYEAALSGGPEGMVVAVMAGDAQMDPGDLPKLLLPLVRERSEERRVGKECRSRWWPELEK